MVEECNCIMKSEIKRMQEDIKKGEEKIIATEKIVYEIKDSHSQTKFIMEQIKINQDAMTLANEKNQIEASRANKENQVEAARINKENAIAMASGFKEIADKKAAEEKAAIETKKADNIEQIRLKELLDGKEEDLQKEKRKQNWGIWIIIIGLGLNFVVGFFIKYIPKMVGL